jgi:hypothetical protein
LKQAHDREYGAAEEYGLPRWFHHKQPARVLQCRLVDEKLTIVYQMWADLAGADRWRSGCVSPDCATMHLIEIAQKDWNR